MKILKKEMLIKEIREDRIIKRKLKLACITEECSWQDGKSWWESGETQRNRRRERPALRWEDEIKEQMAGARLGRTIGPDDNPAEGDTV